MEQQLPPPPPAFVVGGPTPPKIFILTALEQKREPVKFNPINIKINKPNLSSVFPEAKEVQREKKIGVKIIDKTADVIVDRNRLLKRFSSVIHIIEDAPSRQKYGQSSVFSAKIPYPEKLPERPFVGVEEKIDELDNPTVIIPPLPPLPPQTIPSTQNAPIKIRISKKKTKKEIERELKESEEPEEKTDVMEVKTKKETDVMEVKTKKETDVTEVKTKKETDVTEVKTKKETDVTEVEEKQNEPENKTDVMEVEKEPEIEKEIEMERELGKETEKPKKRATKTQKKKMTQLGVEPATSTKINDKIILSRLPKREPIKIKTSKYYLTNRKKYIENISKLFHLYETELSDNKNDISCDSSDKTENTELFIHQRIVREYLNVITPYRGLLLYHGLGSGKTCSSIAIAEGMKTNKQIVLMTPAALKTNFFSELKKCGDPLYKKNQYWEFISVEGKPEYAEILSSALSLERGDILKNGGAWLVDIRIKEPNYEKLTAEDQRGIDLQLDKMIRAKYWDINYDGLTKRKIDEITQNKKVNPFDNKTVIIDEAHKFVSRIVNKIKDKGSSSYILYDYLMSASNAKIILLTGTPIVNYPNEIGILFNILRGYIKTWKFQLSLGANAPSGESITVEKIGKMFQQGGLNTFDYLDYTNNILTITRNPFGFVNAEKINSSITKSNANANTKKGTQIQPPDVPTKKGVKTKKKPTTVTKKRTTKKIITKNINIPYNDPIEFTDPQDNTDETDENNNYKPNYNEGEPAPETKMVGGDNYINDNYQGVELDENGNITDQDFEEHVRRILRNHNTEIIEDGTKVINNKSLPDDSETFFELFIDAYNKSVKNEISFKKRILGLTSYFRSANEDLLPRLVTNDTAPDATSKNYFIVPCFMSPTHLSYYGKIRKAEADKERTAKKNAAKNKGKEIADLYQITSSYRSFSRAACNFAFPEEINRPLPERRGDNIDLTEDDTEKDNENENEKDNDEDENEDENKNGETENITTKKTEEEITYRERVNNALQELKSSVYLKKENLQTYSSKFYHILENIQNPEHRGLHLLYSIFRTLEGIGILKLVFEANGMVEFKIRKNGREWEIDNAGEPITPQSFSAPRFVLYTGTESAEEKEIIRNIYNSNWEVLPPSLTETLRKISPNNYFGEIIKVFMITASGTEGINLKNTRYVHIVEPYWNMSRIEQTIGRARRICSHKDLPEELRTVQVFFYISSFTEEQIKAGDNREMMVRDVSRINGRPITTDENLYEIADIKTAINNKILHSVKETAMDCSVYSGTSTKEGDEQLVCYNVGQIKTNAFLSFPSFQEEILLGETDAINVRKEKVKLVKFPHNGVDYALDKSNYILYSLKSYELAKQGNGVLQQVGRLEKRAGKFEPVFV